MDNEQIRATYVSHNQDDVGYHPQRRFTHYELKASKRHLGMLSGAYYLVAILFFILGLISFLYLGLGIATLCGWVGRPPKGEEFVEVCFIFSFIAFVSALIWTFFGCIVLMGRSLVGRRRYRFCVIMAALLCALPPLGTLLGLATILVLMRDSVKELFAHGDFAFQTDQEDE